MPVTNLPKADKYEVVFYGPYKPMCTTVDPTEALAAVSEQDGWIYAINNCRSRVVAAKVNGVLLNGRDYDRYLNLTDGGVVRARVDVTSS
jgi:hypothetical protein